MDITMWVQEACYWLVKLVMIKGQNWDSLPHQRSLVLWDSNKTSVSILSMVLTCWKECTLLYAWNSQLSFTILDRHIGLFMEFTWYMLPITKSNSISECLNVQCIDVKRNSDQYLFFSFFVHFNMEVIPMYTWKATKNLKSLIYCLWNHVIYLWWCASMCMTLVSSAKWAGSIMGSNLILQLQNVLLVFCETQMFDIPSYSRYWPAIVQFLQ